MMRCEKRLANIMGMILYLSVSVSIGLFGFSKEDHIQTHEKPFVILISSYNNEKFARQNIISAITQRYSNYRVIFINDMSSDRTLEIVRATIQEYKASEKVTIIDNKERKLGLRNYYEAIVGFTKDEEIILNLDGDDRLANRNVLKFLNKVYNSKEQEIWLTYGQFAYMSNQTVGFNHDIPEDIFKNADFRKLHHTPSHLRTFYAWLFKTINPNDFLYEGHFFEMTWDLAFMFPLLEMCGERFLFIDKILYIYNNCNPISDCKCNQALQDFYSRYIRGLPKYQRLSHDIFHVCEDKGCVVCNKKFENQTYDAFILRDKQ